MNPLAEKLNATLSSHLTTLSLLSDFGRGIFFPWGGIMGQSGEAKGKTYNATIGIALEDDKTPMRLSSLVDGLPVSPADTLPYAPSFGLPALREEWKAQIYKKNPSLSADISLPVATCGLTHGLTTVVKMFCNPGDSILMTDKYWGNYRLMFTQSLGVTIDTFNTFRDGGFDVSALAEALAERRGQKVTLLLNVPNNPSGYMPTQEEAQQIVQVLTRAAEDGTKMVVLLDDAYFGLVYEEGIETQSLFAYLADAHENILAIKLDGATKEDYVWGLRIGFVTFAQKGLTEEQRTALADKTAGTVRGSVSNIPRLSQSLVLKALQSESYAQEKAEKLATLKGRYQKVKEMVSRPEFADAFSALPFNAGYFMCVELNENIDAEAVRKLLLEEYDTGVIAVGNMLRIAFSCLPVSDIETVFTNIYAACQQVSSAEPTLVS